MYAKTLVLIAIVASFCFGCHSPQPAKARAPNAPLPSAENILTAMRERYRTAKSYRDEGHFRDVTSHKDGLEFVDTGRFRTVWNHQSWQGATRFAFELRIDPDEFSPSQTMAVWTPKSGSVSSLLLGEVEYQDSISDGLYAMQGVSHFVTGLVPRLLVGGDCTCDAHYEVRATVACGSATCFELEGTSSERGRTTLFIDTKTSALRKYVQRRTIVPNDGPPPAEVRERLTPEELERFTKLMHEPFDVETTIAIEPSFDIGVDDAEFERSESGRSAASAPAAGK